MNKDDTAAWINDACVVLANAVKASGQQSVATVLYSTGEVCVITATIVPTKQTGSQLVIPTPHTN